MFMQAMIRSDMVTEIQYNLGNVSNLAAHINTWMNWSLEDIASVFNWRDMYVHDRFFARTVENTQEYALPEDCKDIVNLTLKDGVNSRSLTYKPPKIFKKQHPSPQDDGTQIPTEYTREGYYVKLYHIPGEPYPMYLDYYRWPDDFDRNADNQCPIKHAAKAVVAQATAYGYAARRELDKNRWWHGFAWQLLRRSARAERTSDWTPQWATERTQRIAHKQGVWTPPYPVGSEIPQLTYTFG